MDGPGLDPGILEHTLKPIAFTEQAAAVATKTHGRSRQFRSRLSRCHQRGRGTTAASTISKPAIGAARLRSAFLKLFERVDALVTPTVAVTAFEAGQTRCRQDRRPRGRSASRLVAVLLADQPGRPAGGDDAVRLRSRRLADRPSDRRALARRAHDLPHRRCVRAAQPWASSGRRWRYASRRGARKSPCKQGPFYCAWGSFSSSCGPSPARSARRGR